jgi:hypothetical protein
MPKLEFVDDLFAPSDAIVINYSGSNPFRVAQIIKPLMEKIVQVESKDTFERVFKWDITEDPRSFYDFWHCVKEEDKWTGVLIKVTIQGKQHSQTKKGNVRIEITGFLQTRFDYNNIFQQIFWTFYNKTFYYKRRRQYLERGKEYIFAIRDEIFREMKIPRG